MRLIKMLLIGAMWVAIVGCITTKTLVSKSARGSISGKVVDASSGQPLPGVNVILLDTDIGTSTDKDGVYFLPNIPVGIYDLEFGMIGWKTLVSTDVKVFVNDTTIVSIKLDEASAILRESSIEE